MPAELPRLSSLVEGEQYDFPVVLKKIGKIKITSHRESLFSVYDLVWKASNVDKIATGRTIRMMKSHRRLMASRITGIYNRTDPFSLREARPRNNAVIRELVDPIVDEQHIPNSDYLMLDYVLEQTLMGKPYAVLWWLPADVITRGLRSITRRNVRTSDRTTGNIVGDILGHANFAQVGGPRLEFWQDQYLNYVPRVPNTAATNNTDNNDNNANNGIDNVGNTISNRRAGPIDTSVYNSISNAGTLNIPAGSTNTVTLDDIAEGDDMVNFHGEHGYGRYYKQSTFNQLPIMNSYIYKKNPTTRQVIRRNNTLRKYKAHLVGGKKRKTRKNH